MIRWSLGWVLRICQLVESLGNHPGTHIQVQENPSVIPKTEKWTSLAFSFQCCLASSSLCRCVMRSVVVVEICTFHNWRCLRIRGSTIHRWPREWLALLHHHVASPSLLACYWPPVEPHRATVTATRWDRLGGQVTNYRFRKSMGWEIKPSLLYQAYVKPSDLLIEIWGTRNSKISPSRATA